MSANMTPLQVAAAVFGGMSFVAPAVGLDRTRASHWNRSQKTRPAGDFPSLKIVRDIRRAALDQMGLDIPLDWLIYGAPEADVRALIANTSKVAAE